MRTRFNKSKGATLIEVLVSIAIFSVVSIPLSMAVISSIGNNKKGESEQYAVACAQQIVEGLRANNTTTPNIVTIKTNDPYDLKFNNISTPSTGHDVGYLASEQNIGNGFKASVTFERKLPYEAASTTNNAVLYDLIIQMDRDSIIVTGTNSNGITGDTVYSLTDDKVITQIDDLKICNNDKNTIQFLNNNTNKVLGTYKPFNILTDSLIDNIKISYLPNYGPHTIYFENDATNSLSVYIFKQDNRKENIYTNSKGSIKFYDNLSSAPIVDGTSGIYDIDVDIYKGESPNKVKVYSTKTSISLGT